MATPAVWGRHDLGYPKIMAIRLRRIAMPPSCNALNPCITPRPAIHASTNRSVARSLRQRFQGYTRPLMAM